VNRRQARWSWARTLEEVEEFRSEASQLVGKTLAAVSYVTLDYASSEVGPHVGPRQIHSPHEWSEPCWQHVACHTVEFAVEFSILDGGVFTVSWDSPGSTEGIGIKEGRAVGLAVTDTSSAAVWNVSHTEQWRQLVGLPINSVLLQYEPWDANGAWWCPQIELNIGGSFVGLLLAEGPWDSDRAVPSADNIAVTFGPLAAAPW
jgi:hypothetical protein